VYQELSGAGSIADVDEVERELADRFGPMPKSVIALLLLMRIKVLARALGCVKVTIAQDGGLALSFEGEDAAVRERIGRLFPRRSGSLRLSAALLLCCERNSMQRQWKTGRSRQEIACAAAMSAWLSAAPSYIFFIII